MKLRIPGVEALIGHFVKSPASQCDFFLGAVGSGVLNVAMPLGIGHRRVCPPVANSSLDAGLFHDTADMDGVDVTGFCARLGPRAMAVTVPTTFVADCSTSEKLSINQC